MGQNLISAEQVLSVAYPDGGELRYGFERRILGRAQVVDVLIHEWERDIPLTQDEEAIAFLLRDELDSLDDLVLRLPDSSLLPGGTVAPNAGMRFWLYVLLSRVLAERLSSDQLWSRVDDIHSIFGYAGSMTPIVRVAGDPVPMEESLARLEDYIRRESQFYSVRARPDHTRQ